MGHLRDYQRSKLYRTEDCHSKRRTTFPNGFDGARSMFVMMMESRWMRSRYPETAARATLTKGSAEHGSAADYLSFSIRLSMSGAHCGPLILCHEVAHLCTREGKSATFHFSGHGREFCRTYIAIVRRFMSREDADELRALFVANRIRFKGTDSTHVKRAKRYAREGAVTKDPQRLAELRSICARGRAAIERNKELRRIEYGHAFPKSRWCDCAAKRGQRPGYNGPALQVGNDCPCGHGLYHEHCTTCGGYVARERSVGIGRIVRATDGRKGGQG